MKIIVGLGNPGRKYERTRHNAGFLALDELAELAGVSVEQEKHSALVGRGRLGSEDVVLAKPRTFMNESGRAVAALLRSSYRTCADLIVLHDELDLAPGSVRIKTGGGHGGHNGLRSIMELAGSADFIRIRIGIGRPPAGVDAADYVLSPFSAEERKAAADAFRKAAEAARAVVLDGPERAMNQFNQR